MTTYFLSDGDNQFSFEASSDDEAVKLAREQAYGFLEETYGKDEATELWNGHVLFEVTNGDYKIASFDTDELKASFAASLRTEMLAELKAGRFDDLLDAALAATVIRTAH